MGAAPPHLLVGSLLMSAPVPRLAQLLGGVARRGAMPQLMDGGMENAQPCWPDENSILLAKACSSHLCTQRRNGLRSAQIRTYQSRRMNDRDQAGAQGGLGVRRAGSRNRGTFIWSTLNVSVPAFAFVQASRLLEHG